MSTAHAQAEPIAFSSLGAQVQGRKSAAASCRCRPPAAALWALTAVRLPVQAHPGLMAASMPWLGGRDFKRLCAWMPHAVVALMLARGWGAGRVTIGRDGLPRLHYRPDKHDRESMMQVTAAGYWPGDQVTECASKQWLAACHAAASGQRLATLRRMQPACTAGVKAFNTGSMTHASVDLTPPEHCSV